MILTAVPQCMFTFAVLWQATSKERWISVLLCVREDHIGRKPNTAFSSLKLTPLLCQNPIFQVSSVCFPNACTLPLLCRCVYKADDNLFMTRLFLPSSTLKNVTCDCSSAAFSYTFQRHHCLFWMCVKPSSISCDTASPQPESPACLVLPHAPHPSTECWEVPYCRSSASPPCSIVSPGNKFLVQGEPGHARPRVCT